MAKKMNYSDDNGIEFNDTVWLPLFIAADFNGVNGRVEFFGFMNQDLATKKLKHSLGIPGGANVRHTWSKSYSLSETDVRHFAMAPIEGQTTLEDLSASMYDVAESVKDTDPTSGSARKPSSKEDAVSFFHDAVDVNLV